MQILDTKLNHLEENFTWAKKEVGILVRTKRQRLNYTFDI